jgi:hypothetical protein
MCREVKAPCSAFSNASLLGASTPMSNSLRPLLGKSAGGALILCRDICAVFQPVGIYCILRYLDWLILKGSINVIEPERTGNSTLYQTALLQAQKVLILILLRYEDTNWIQSVLVNMS